MPRDAISSRLPAPPSRFDSAQQDSPASCLFVFPRQSARAELYLANNTEFPRWRDEPRCARPWFPLPTQPLFRYDASSAPRKCSAVNVEVTEPETRGQPKAPVTAKCATVSYRNRGSTNGNYFQLAWKSHSGSAFIRLQLWRPTAKGRGRVRRRIRPGHRAYWSASRPRTIRNPS